MKTTILSNCQMLLLESMALFKEMHFARSCFLAMTSIEEAGKFSYLWNHPGNNSWSHSNSKDGSYQCRTETNKEVTKFLADHHKKALEAVVLTLHKNEEANRRHGKDPRMGHFWTSGMREIIEHAGWMPLRNACLYVDLKTTASPIRLVSQSHASYMICMGHEIVADLVDLEVEGEIYDPYRASLARNEIIRQLERFSLNSGSTKNWEGLNFSNILSYEDS